MRALLFVLVGPQRAGAKAAGADSALAGALGPACARPAQAGGQKPAAAAVGLFRRHRGLSRGRGHRAQALCLARYRRPGAHSEEVRGAAAQGRDARQPRAGRGLRHAQGRATADDPVSPVVRGQERAGAGAPQRERQGEGLQHSRLHALPYLGRQDVPPDRACDHDDAAATRGNRHLRPHRHARWRKRISKPGAMPSRTGCCRRRACPACASCARPAPAADVMLTRS